MITLRQVREHLNADPQNWRVYLMDFVDDFRRRKDSEAVAEPFTLAVMSWMRFWHLPQKPFATN
jgi:hypothetical protein